MAYRNRSRLRLILSSPFTLVLAAVLLFLLTRAAWNIHSRSVEVGDRLAGAEADLFEVKAARDLSAAQAARLSTESGVRAEAREKYRAVEQGEFVAVIVDAPAREVVTGTLATSADPKKRGWWSRLFLRD